MRAEARPRSAPARPGRADRSRWALRIVAVLGLVVVAAGCTAAGDVPQDVLDPAGPVARSQDRLWQLVFPIAVGVFVLVEAALLFAIFRYRDRGGDDVPKQVAGNTKVEIVWTLIPAIILAGVAVPTVQTLFELSERPTDDPLNVRVVGKQYWWEFEYLDDEGQGVVTSTDLHIPTNRPVFLEMQSLSAVISDPGYQDLDVKSGDVNRGVIHSFWVPRLAGKQDVVPYHTRTLTIQADDPGVYEGQCAEFCGLSHARMRFNVIAEEPGDFDSWIAAQAEPAQVPTGGLAREGWEAFTSAQCIGCHAIQGYSGDPAEDVATARVGPDLTHFASREELAGGILDNDEENLRAWLANPQEVKPGAQMPNLGLTDDQIDALVAYLATLE